MNPQLTQGQLAAKTAFNLFMSDPNELFFSICGHAGTGKTFLIKNLVAENSHIPMYFTATTNKAVNVLENQLGNGQCPTTIHRFLNLKVVTDYKTGKKSLAATKPLEITEALVFIDEGSMIDPPMLNKIESIAVKNKLKIVFIGDPCQLYPINYSFCPAFESGYPSAYLTEMKRQNTNELTEINNTLREKVLGDTEGRIKVNGKNILRVKREEFKKMFLKDIALPDWDGNYSKYVAYTNKAVTEMNAFVKNNLSGTTRLQKNEFAVNNSYISSSKEKYTLKTDQVVFINEVIHDVTELNCPGCYISLDDGIKLFVPYNIEDKEIQLQLAVKDDNSNRYKYIDSVWADIRSMYACTVHKSQGSTYKKVYIDISDIERVQHRDEDLFNRLLYVAASRASDQVIFVMD